VLVTINYRLGALGFLNTASLPGNYGLMDQQLALQWVRDNIAAFGGDRSSVTIMGQSSGATSVAMHLWLPTSWPLYDAAIVHSNPQGLVYRTPLLNEMFSNIFARDLFCNVTDDACLRSRSWQDIVIMQLIPEYIHTYHGLHTWEMLIWGPTIDGTFFPSDPWTLMSSGRFNRNAPILMGTVRNESYGFFDFIQPIIAKWDYEIFLPFMFGSNATMVFDIYPASDATAFNAMVRLTTDEFFTCPARYMAVLATQWQQAPVYTYEFVHVPSIQPPGRRPRKAAVPGAGSDPCVNGVAVCHSADLVFVFHTASFWDLQYTADENVLSLFMLKQWASFVANHRLSSPWVPYSAAGDASLLLDTPAVQPTTGYRTEFCDFWDQFGYQF